MFSMVQFSRVIPYVYPQFFGKETPQESAAASVALPETAAAEEPTLAMIKERRMRGLYLRSLRSQGNSETLTYSGLLSA